MLLQTTKQKRLLLNAFAFLFRVFGAVGEEKKNFKSPDDRQKVCAFQQRPPFEKERERRMNTGGDDDDDDDGKKKKKNEEKE